jgi:hypothetical protein
VRETDSTPKILRSPAKLKNSEKDLPLSARGPARSRTHRANRGSTVQVKTVLNPGLCCHIKRLN